MEELLIFKMSIENDFTVSDDLSDIILVVEEKELHVHKSILGKLIDIHLLYFRKISLFKVFSQFKAMHSPVFEKIFTRKV